MINNEGKATSLQMREIIMKLNEMKFKLVKFTGSAMTLKQDRLEYKRM